VPIQPLAMAHSLDMKIEKALMMAAISAALAGCTTETNSSKGKTEAGITETRLSIHDTIGMIERDDEMMDSLIPPGAIIEKLAEGYRWSEGPVWLDRGGYLLFSDVPQNTVYRWKWGVGVTPFLKPSGYTGQAARGGEPGSNGLTLDHNGNLILCEHGDRRVARLEKNGAKTTLAERYQGKKFNSPNDLVVKSNGDIYFTDPPYGLEGRDKDPKKELTFSGVYRVVKNGTVTLLTDKLSFPNGIEFSPDEKTLYVAISDPARPVIMAFDVKADGTLENERVFFDASHLTSSKKGLPDGLKVDLKGNLFATGPGGVLVISPRGKHLGTINTDQPTANCAWGEDGTVLYITANHFLCRIQTSTKGKLAGRL